MKKQLFHFVICIAGLFPAKTLYARQTIVTSGGNAKGSSIHVSHSISRVAFITAEGANASINQGVQHTYEFYTAESENPQILPPSDKVYPDNFVDLTYSILQMTTPRTSTSATGSIRGLSPGTYTIGLGVYNSGGAIQLSNNDHANRWVMVVN